MCSAKTAIGTSLQQCYGSVLLDTEVRVMQCDYCLFLTVSAFIYCICTSDTGRNFSRIMTEIRLTYMKGAIDWKVLFILTAKCAIKGNN